MGVLSSYGGLAGLVDLLVVLWLLSEVWIRVHARSAGAPLVRDRHRDRGSGLGILGAYVALFLTQFVYAIDPFWGIFPVWARLLGDLGMVLGIVLRMWAISFLGRYFTGIVTLQPGQKVVRDGPYRWVRHPSYTGALLTTFSYPFAAGGLLTLVVAIAVMPLAFAYRIRVEERMLAEGLGDEYRAYMRETRRLIPGLL